MHAGHTTAAHPAGHVRRTRWLVVLIALLTFVALSWYPLSQYLQAIAVLLRIESSSAHGFFANRGIHPITTEDGNFQSGPFTLRTRLYIPTNAETAPGMVIVPGVHHLGYEEPRLVQFAKAMSSAGLIVSTPDMPELSNYKINPVSIENIAAAADDLSARLHTSCVGVLGLSFAGGLALKAAGEPRFSEHICYVVSVGGYDDLGRVMRYFATDEMRYPDGRVQKLQANRYGLLVAIYAHLEEYFAPADIALAGNAIHDQLYEEIAKAEQIVPQLSPPGQALLKELFSNDFAPAQALVLANLDKHRAEMAAVSPDAVLPHIHVPVLLLHGAGDNVIPPSETAWLAQQIPPRYLRAELISPAISHVEVGKGATILDKFRLVQFIVQMLREAKSAPHNTVDLTHALGAATLAH